MNTSVLFISDAFDEMARQALFVRPSSSQVEGSTAEISPSYIKIEDAIRRALKDVGDRQGGRKRRQSEPRHGRKRKSHCTD